MSTPPSPMSSLTRSMNDSRDLVLSNCVTNESVVDCNTSAESPAGNEMLSQPSTPGSVSQPSEAVAGTQASAVEPAHWPTLQETKLVKDKVPKYRGRNTATPPPVVPLASTIAEAIPSTPPSIRQDGIEPGRGTSTPLSAGWQRARRTFRPSTSNRATIDLTKSSPLQQLIELTGAMPPEDVVPVLSPSPECKPRVEHPVPHRKSPSPPTSGLGKRSRLDSSAPTTPVKPRENKKVKSEPLSPTVSMMLPSLAEEEMWRTVGSPSDSTLAALDLRGISQQGADRVDTIAEEIEGPSGAKDDTNDPNAMDIDDPVLMASHPSNPTSSIEQRLFADHDVGEAPPADLSKISETGPDRAGMGAPMPIPSFDSTHLRDTRPSHHPMNSVPASPTLSIRQMLSSRIPAAEKGKGRLQPTPGPSKPSVMRDEFYAPPTGSASRPPFLHASFNPDDSSCTIFPPQPAASSSLEHRPPTSPSRLMDKYHLFESNMARRGPAISRTLLAESFPAVYSTPAPAPPAPPMPYVEDGEIVEETDAPVSGLHDFLQQQAENVPVDQDDFLTYLPPPPEGFPPIHFTSPLGAYANIDDGQLFDWDRETRNGLIALGISFGGCGALDGDIDPRYRQLLPFAAHLLNARFHTDRITIAQPQPKQRVMQLNSPPHTALVYGLKKEEAEELISDGVMCTPRLAMFFHPLGVAFPSFIGAVHGLTTRLIQPVYEMVLNHFLSPEAEKLFRNLTSRPPNPVVSPDKAQALLVNSMYVRSLDCRAKGNTLAPVFLVYMQSPATDYHSFRLWSAFCRKINLRHSLYGTGYLKSPGVCSICHGHDHPTGLCRFTRIPGWLAPPPSQPPNFSIPPPVPASKDSWMKDKGRPQKTKKRRGDGQKSRE